MMKSCQICKIAKPVEDFGPMKKSPDGLMGRCRLCANTVARAAWVLKRERVNQERKLKPKRQRPSSAGFMLQYHYNITPAIRDAMTEAQGGICAICGSPPSENKHLYIDHDHRCCKGERSCGKCIRGLLCARCNTGIGMLKDDSHLLDVASEYLKSYGL